MFQAGCRGLPSFPLQKAWAAYKAEVLVAHARSIADKLEVTSTQPPDLNVYERLAYV